MATMIPAGYMYKQIALRPQHLRDVPHIEDIYSLSGCISNDFGDFIIHWQHNGFWLFDQPGIDLAPMTLFYYEAYGLELNDDSDFSTGEPGTWSNVVYNDFPTNVVLPPTKALHGFDVVTHMNAVADPGCSPLACNNIAKKVAVNRHCLFDTFQQAKVAVDTGVFTNCEIGALRIFAVYTV
jgi:hypothetical protein